MNLYEFPVHVIYGISSGKTYRYIDRNDFVYKTKNQSILNDDVIFIRYLYDIGWNIPEITDLFKDIYKDQTIRRCAKRIYYKNIPEQEENDLDMALKKLEETVKGTRILVYGAAGSLKSRLALTFPKNIYIDSDQGADSYYDEFSDNLVKVSDSTTYKEVMEDLDELEDIKDDFETITLDNFTKIFENQQHTALNIAEQRAMKAGRNKDAEGLSFKDYGKMNLTNDIILSKILEFKKDGKTVIILTEGKEEKESIPDGNGGTITRVIGVIPNAPKAVDHDFDIVLETLKDKKTGEPMGAKVIKDRLGVTKSGDVIPPEKLNYELWKDVIESRKKGVVKQKKRDIANDLKENETTIVGEDPQPIKDEISSIIKNLTKEQQNSLVTKLKDKHGTHKFNDVNDVDKLKAILKTVKSHK